jgi:TonB family protein
MRTLLTALALLASCGFAQDGAAPVTHWADQAEFDMASAAAKATGAATRLDYLDRWSVNYPVTDSLNARLEMYLGSYQQLNPANLNSRALIATVLRVLSANPSPANLDAAEKSANLLLNSPDTLFAAADKPSGITETQWAKAKAQTKPFAEQVLSAIDKIRNGGTAASPQLNRPQAANPIPETPLQAVEPQYSEEARIAALEGSVLVTGTIGSDGSIEGLRVSRPLGLGLDEQAIAAAAQMRFQPGAQRSVTLPIDFALPSKQSRWHLVEAEFKPPAGASRPAFAKADYPFGSGISLAAYDEARLLGAIGRAATATVSFDIDDRGTPGNFQVVDASADVWGPEAVMVVQSWRFNPGMKAGMPVSVPCTLKLVWGPEDFTANAIGNQIAQMYAPPPSQGELVAAPAILSKTEPEYTDEARQAGIEGSVVMRVIVGQEGKPVQTMFTPTASGTNVGSGPGAGLIANATEAIMQWRFQPPRLVNGVGAVSLMVRVDFRLSGVESAIFNPPVAASKPSR